jgi:hypothetical protein
MLMQRRALLPLLIIVLAAAFAVSVVTRDVSRRRSSRSND